MAGTNILISDLSKQFLIQKYSVNKTLKFLGLLKNFFRDICGQNKERF